MDDGWEPPLYTKFRDTCPICGTKIVSANDPLMMIWNCPKCNVQVNPEENIYSETPKEG